MVDMYVYDRAVIVMLHLIMERSLGGTSCIDHLPRCVDVQSDVQLICRTTQLEDQP